MKSTRLLGAITAIHLALAGTALAADDLAAAGVAVHVLGDANKCGNIRDAIGDGYKVACEL